MTVASDYLPVGVFGKLPFEKDHLPVEAHRALPGEMQRWIRAGAEALREPVHEVTETRRLRFVFALPGAPDWIVGVLRPSADRVGRDYPFLVFTRLARRQWGRHYELLPLGLAATWDALDDLWDSLAAVPSADTLNEVLEGAGVPGPRLLAEVQNDYREGERQRAARLFERHDGAAWHHLSRGLPELLRLIKKAPDAQRVELPVGANLEEALFDTSFWLDVVTRPFLWRHPEPSVFLDSAAETRDRRLGLIFGVPQAEDYPWLTVEGRPGSAVQRPAHPAASAAVAEAGPDSGVPTFAEIAAGRF